MAFGNACGDRAYADLRNQLHADPRFGIDVLQVEDQLGKVFDRINIVMRRGRDQSHSGSGITGLGDNCADFMPGQLPAFPGLGALRDLDLEFVGIDQVIGSHPESSGSDLFYCAAEAVAVRQRNEPSGVFSSFACIGLSSHAIHGQSHGPVRLSADRAEAHSTGAETLDDALERLDLFYIDRGYHFFELKKGAQSSRVLGLVVDQPAEFFILKGIVLAHGFVHCGNALGIPEMELPVFFPLVQAAGREEINIRLPFAESVLMALQCFLEDDVHAGSTYSGNRAPETAVDDRPVQPQRFKYLCSSVTLKSRNPHLGKYLQQPFIHRLDIIMQSVFFADLAAVFF